MAPANPHITLAKLDKDEELPFDLLLLADPSRKMIDSYVKNADVYEARLHDQRVGVIVLYPLNSETIEIKNIAVEAAFQRKGIGTCLIAHAIKLALDNEKKSICIGTANSSIAQLCLYQQLGFDITDIKENFFTHNYPEPIYENGIQAKHLIILTRHLTEA